MTRPRERWSDRASKRPPPRKSPCKEPSCHRPFTRTRRDQEFCGKPCKRRYDSRALTRSRGVYEALRDWHAGKSKSNKADPIKQLSTEALRFLGREVARWRDEDAAARTAADRARNA